MISVNNIIARLIRRLIYMELSQNQILVLKRKKGERNLTINALAKEIGVSRWTVSRIINGTKTNFNSPVVKKVNNWLIDEMVKDGE